MKIISILKNLITFYYYILYIGFIGLAFIAFLFFSDRTYNLKLECISYQIGSISVFKKVIILIIFSAFYTLYFFGIKFLKNSMDDLALGKYFSKSVISNFKNSGKLFLICAAVNMLIGVILSLILEFPLKVGIDSGFLHFIVMGLFFLFLSEVFSKGNEMQNENNLTI